MLWTKLKKEGLGAHMSNYTNLSIVFSLFSAGNNVVQCSLLLLTSS